MATGPEHYREAERWLFKAEKAGARGSGETPESCAAIAQGHATLSLAAATALGREGEGRTQPGKDRAAWFEAASECKKEATV